MSFFISSSSSKNSSILYIPAIDCCIVCNSIPILSIGAKIFVINSMEAATVPIDKPKKPNLSLEIITTTAITIDLMINIIGENMES